MKGLKIIATLSFLMIFYPIVAVPGVWKEWTVAIVSGIIFILSLLLIFIFAHNDKQTAQEESEANKCKLPEENISDGECG